MFLSQRKYAFEILERAYMVNCNPSQTPIDIESNLGDDVQHVCIHMHDPREPYFSALKRISRSTLGYCVFLGNNLISSSSKRQPTLSSSNVDAEYRGVANVVAETCWLRNLIRELHTPLSFATLVYCDNYADNFTKGLPSALFEEFHISWSVRRLLVLTAGECQSYC
nr:hypothetical protein [Tanacetum cinerariifolium]